MLVFRPVFADATNQRPRGLVLAALRLGDALAVTGHDSVVDTELLLANEINHPESLVFSRTNNNPSRARLNVIRPIFSFGKTFIVSAQAGPAFLSTQPARSGLEQG